MDDSSAPPSVRAGLVADARRIDQLLGDLTVNAGTAADLEAEFSLLELAIDNHIVTEEATIVPQIQRVSPRDARVIYEEHRYLRQRLVEVRLTLGAKSLGELRQELAAHERTEERIVAQWLGTTSG